MVVRAFLSHASIDKPFVEKVAQFLGRAAVVYDAYEFTTGDDLKKAILDGLSKTEIFVLFASESSLKRDWVKFEISEAEAGHIAQKISSVLTFIIDPKLKLSEIPAWLKASLITESSSPMLVATDIRRAISRKINETRPKHFVGRNSELDQALDIITSFSDPTDRPPLLIYGLTGIGRRSLAEAIGRDGLSFQRTHIIRLSEGDLLPELYLKLLASLGGTQTVNPNEQILELSNEGNISVVKKILEILKTICLARSLPVIFDQGALSDEDGILREEFDLVYSAIRSDADIDAVLVSNRRIHNSEAVPLPSIRLPELSPDSTQRLVRLLARDRGLIVSRTDAEIVASYSRGYPPAVMFAAQEMETYGVPHLVANTSTLSKFSERIFLKQLQSNPQISETKLQIMQLLSSYSPLPLPVIRDYLEISSDILTIHMTYLLDYAFISPDGVNYRISEPVRQAAYQAFNGLRVDHGKISYLLEGYLEEFEEDDTRLALGQNLFRAATLSGSTSNSKFAVTLASDLIEMAVQSYHDQDYDRSIKVGKLALEARPDSINVRRFLAQALIRKEQYEDAVEHINYLIDRGYAKHAFYIKGFMNRRKRHYKDAIADYKKSLDYGRGGVPVHRELASCYFEEGNMADAQAQILEAERVSPDNKYVVDLKCMIAIRREDEGAALKALAVLERVDDSGFYEHRRSTFEHMRGNASDALKYAQMAVEKRDRPQFEILANLANCQIEMNELDDATITLKQIDTRFSNQHNDTRTGLRCKLETKRGDIPLAEGLWKKIKSSDLGVHIGLRASLLSKKQQISSLSPEETEELKYLSKTISDNKFEKTVKLFGSEFTHSE